MVRRTSIQTARHAVQIAVYGLIFIHIYVFYGAGARGIGSVGFEEFFRSFLQQGVFNAGALLVVRTLVSTVALGACSVAGRAISERGRSSATRF
jgi:hypothetical protein